ncbi:MAG: hypothetical protein FWF88_11975 [Peptococcaceae bacterium]|nr:hypothetical protein [Peptococcaceae bacterium]
MLRNKTTRLTPPFSMDNGQWTMDNGQWTIAMGKADILQPVDQWTIMNAAKQRNRVKLVCAVHALARTVIHHEWLRSRITVTYHSQVSFPIVHCPLSIVNCPLSIAFKGYSSAPLL